MPVKLTAIPATLSAGSKRTLRRAGLVFSSDRDPGIRRERIKGGFTYRTPQGHVLQAARTLARIASLVIPPAWRDVWICPDPRGHIQATGHDDRGRKQYIYHPRWREIRDEVKYSRLLAFAEALGPLKRRLDHDLRRRRLTKDKVVATIIRLMQTTLIRVGNEEYARQNHSFGLTTLRNGHVAVNGSTIHFQFRGKSGIEHIIDLHDRRLAKIVRECQELPGQELFQFEDSRGQLHGVSSSDVNAYLREATGEEFSAKDIRTWAGTVLTAAALREQTEQGSRTQSRRNIVAAIKQVAERLGNTCAVCRKSYVHPAVFDAYLDGTLVLALDAVEIAQRKIAHLSPEETAVYHLLRRRLKT